MRRACVLASILLLTGVSLAQEPSSTNNPPDNSPNAIVHHYSLPETGHNWGGWGLLGLLGLGGLLGRRRETTYVRDERTYKQQQRHA